MGLQVLFLLDMPLMARPRHTVVPQPWGRWQPPLQAPLPSTSWFSLGDTWWTEESGVLQPTGSQ